MRWILVPVLAAALTAPAMSQGSAPPTQPGAKPAVNPLDKVVCRTEESLGSRLNRKRVCLTVREWREQSEASREATERLQQGQGVIPSG